jgi:hypothetical protein
MCGCVCEEFPEWCASGVPWRVTLLVSPVITLHYITFTPSGRHADLAPFSIRRSPAHTRPQPVPTGSYRITRHNKVRRRSL